MPIVNGEYIYNGITVYFRHLDRLGKNHLLNLFNWAGSAREAYLVETVQNYKELIKKPMLWVTTKISQEVLGEAEFGDVIEIRMVSNRIRRHSFDFVLDTYNVSRGCLIAKGRQTIAFVDANNGTTVEIPEEVMEVIKRIEKNLEKSE